MSEMHPGFPHQTSNAITLSIEDALENIGFIPPCFVRSEALTLLRLLRSRFVALRKHLHHHWLLIDCLLLAGDQGSIAAYLPAQPPGKEELRTAQSINDFNAWLIFDYLPKTGIEKLVNSAPLLLDALAIKWLFACVARHHGEWLESELSLSLADFGSLELDLIHIQRRAIRAPQLTSLADGFEKADFAHWCEELRLLNEPPLRSKPAAKGAISTEHVIRLPEILRALAAAPPAETSLVRNAILEELPDLAETNLWSVNWFYPTPTERTAIKNLLGQTIPLELGASIILNILSLSIFTCRDVASVLGMRIRNEGVLDTLVDHLDWVIELSAKGNAFRRAVWRKAHHGVAGSVTTLYLPLRLSNWLEGINTGSGQPRLADLLPATSLSWSTRAYEMLGKTMGCKPQRARLVTRDLIARLIYEKTGNVALVDFFRGCRVTRVGGSERLALGHYLQISGSRAVDPFTEACQELFPGYRRLAKNTLCIVQGTELLRSDEIASIASALATATSTAEGMAVRHNALALQTLFAAVATTGHRASETPFPFPWDFNREERTVFIADKLIVGSEARFVPLSRYLELSLLEYARHLLLVSREEGLGADVRAYARYVAGMLGVQNATANRRPYVATWEPRFGTFFALSADGQRIQDMFSTADLDEVVFKSTGLDNMVRRMRKTIAQFLWVNDLGGREVQTFLGHHPELHAHGPASAWCGFDWLDRSRPVVEAFIAESRTFCRRLRLAGVSGSAVCSLRRRPRYLKSRNKVPVSVRTRMLAMQSAPAGHRNCRPAQTGVLCHVLLNGLPYIECLAPSKRANVVAAFYQDAVFEALTNGPAVVLDAARQFFRRQVGLRCAHRYWGLHCWISSVQLVTLGGHTVQPRTILIS